ncbi:hypothetical protein CYMTET_11376, partial [Cymbomonas tetramitiformis]
VRALNERGALTHAYCTETRPYNQGSRLTAYELVHEKLPATLICDSAAASLMSQGLVDAVVVGADRVAANGDTANKIGTYNLSIVARHHGIPFFIASPCTTLDPSTATGGDIVIEERSAREITHVGDIQLAAPGIGVWNPGFDVAPAGLIAGIITEKGVISKSSGADVFPVKEFLTEAGSSAPSAFYALDEERILGYVANKAELSSKLGGSSTDWKAREVGDGNINFVYIVDGPAGSLVLKQALPYVRCVGESWPLTQARSKFEALALMTEAASCPEHTPEVYLYDEEMAVIAMQFLAPPHRILRGGIIEGIIYPDVAAHIATFLAKTLYSTSELAVPADTFRAEVKKYTGNVAMCELTEQVIFTEPYIIAANNHWTTPQLDDEAAFLREDPSCHVAIRALKKAFSSNAQALIHGDLHTGSIMVTASETYVIDPEFAYYGPMGFDIGAFLANLLLAYFSMEGHATAASPRTEQKAWLLASVRATWEGFEEKFCAMWTEATALEQSVYMRQLFLDSLGFAGAKMIRRIIGIAHVADLDSIADADLRAKWSGDAPSSWRVQDGARIHTSGRDDSYSGKVHMEFMLVLAGFIAPGFNSSTHAEGALEHGCRKSLSQLTYATKRYSPWRFTPMVRIVNTASSTTEHRECPPGVISANNSTAHCSILSGEFDYAVDTDRFPFDAQQFVLVLEEQADPTGGTDLCLIYAMSGLSSNLDVKQYSSVNWFVELDEKCYPPLTGCINGTESACKPLWGSYRGDECSYRGNVRYKQMHFKINVERPVVKALLRYCAVPLFTIIIVLCSFIMCPVDQLANRFSACSGLLLSNVIFHVGGAQTVQLRANNVSYFDVLLMIAYWVIIVSIVFNTLLIALQRKKSWKDEDGGDSGYRQYAKKMNFWVVTFLVAITCISVLSIVEHYFQTNAGPTYAIVNLVFSLFGAGTPLAVLLVHYRYRRLIPRYCARAWVASKFAAKLS